MNWKRIIYFAVSPFLMILSIWLGWIANESIRNTMLVDRTSVSWIAGMLRGPVDIHGSTRVDDEILIGPFSHQECLYYRKLVEREEEDSDGDKHWVTVTDTSKAVPFRVEDRSGVLQVNPETASIRTTQSHFHRAGDMRYTEWNLKPNTDVFVFGWYTGDKIKKTATVPFVISSLGENEYQVEQGSGGNLFFFFAIVAGTFSIFFGATAFRIHQIPVFCGIMFLFVPVWLLTQWALLIHYETEFTCTQLKGAAFEIANLGKASQQSALAKLSYNDSVQRYEDYRRRIPNRFITWLAHDKSIQKLEMISSESTLAENFPLPERPNARGSWLFGLIFGLIASISLVVTTKFAFNKLRIKRIIENVPTSQAAGIVVGQCELNGTVRPSKNWLTSRYSNHECIWYRYETKEKRSSGKNTKWVVIESGKVGSPFYLRDESGETLVNPEDAEVQGTLIYRQRHGKRIKSEWIIGPNEQVYLLGYARHVNMDDDHLTITKGDNNDKYLISVLPEREIMIGYARIGFLLTTLAANCGSIACIALLAMSGFSPFHFFLSGLFPLAFLAFLVTLFVYNDLIYVARRVKRSFAMLDVALQKRAELIPKLAEIVRGYLDYERELQAKLASMRVENWKSVSDRVEAEEAMSTSMTRIIGVMESNPDLKGNSNALMLQKSLTAIENEISFCRASFNDAVERYNTRIATFPDIILAKLARFEPADYFKPERDLKEKDV